MVHGVIIHEVDAISRKVHLHVVVEVLEKRFYILRLNWPRMSQDNTRDTIEVSK